MSVGINIKKRRYELHLSQQELADAMGYKTRSTIAKIESGENDVSQKKLKKFAEVLNTTVEALISGNTPSPAVSAPADRPIPAKQGRNVAVILAGGKEGIVSRNVPCQFLSVKGKPIVVYCMEAYQKHPSVDDILVVCLKGWETIVRDYAHQYGITKLRGLIPEGSSGMASLKNAVSYMQDLYDGDDLVIIQEATRPLIREETISALLRSCEESGSATICHSMNDYVQFNISDGKAEYVNRNSMIALQSPEAHRLSLVREVFDKAQHQKHPLAESCCTMLLYNLGYPINFLQSAVNNIKIAREEDLAAFSAQILE